MSAPINRSTPPDTTHRVRVLICAVDLLARMGLAALLAEQPTLTIVGQVAPTDDLAKSLAVFQPDVVLWDLGWSGTSLEVLSAFVDDGPPVLALLDDEGAVAEVWAAGVRGILLRNSPAATLAAGLQALFHGLIVLTPGLVAGLPLPTSADTTTLLEPLTARELDVLHWLAQGLSNKLIARQLSISEHTVKFHLNAVLGKLGAQSRTDAVVRATRAGLIKL